MKKYSVISIVVVFFMSVMAIANAQTKDTQSLAADLETCSIITNPLERLVCFDKIVTEKVVKTAEKSAVTNDVSVGKKQEPEERSSTFGSEHIKTEDNGATDEDEKLFIEIVRHSSTAFGYLRIETADGQIWQQVTSERFPFDPEAKYFIERGALGAYYLGRTDLNSRTRVKRKK